MAVNCCLLRRRPSKCRKVLHLIFFNLLLPEPKEIYWKAEELAKITSIIKINKRKRSSKYRKLLHLIFFNLLPGALQAALVVKNPPANAGDIRDMVFIPGLGRSPGEGNGNPLHSSCLGNPMDRGAWWATVHGVTENRTWLTDWTTTKYVDTFNFIKVWWFLNHHHHKLLGRMGFPHSSVGKSSACNAGDLG